MRHFLPLALSPSVLARGMKLGAPKGLLVACTGPMKRFTASVRGAISRAIDMAAITAPADASLFSAPLAVEQPVVVLEQLAIPLESAGESRHKGQWSGCLRVARSQKARGGSRQRLTPGLRFFCAPIKITERVEGRLH